MKKYVFIFGLLIVLLILISYNKTDSKIKMNNNSFNDVKNNNLAIMLETEVGSGKYEESSINTWAIDGYVFNKELSKCTNGNTISYNANTKQVIIKGINADKCYVYFDKVTFADYIISLYTKDGENNLYYHDGTGNYDNANLEAGDYSYRFSGSHLDVQNYICFGQDGNCEPDNLYRIIGIFKNEKTGLYETKLIKADYANSNLLGTETDEEGTFVETTYYKNYEYAVDIKWFFKYKYKNMHNDMILHDRVDAFAWQSIETDKTANWPTAQLNKVHLNKNFLNKFNDDWQSKISFHDWLYKGLNTKNGINSNAKIAFDYELGSLQVNKETTSEKIGLMYLSDYYYGALPSEWSKSGCNGNCTAYVTTGTDDEGIPLIEYNQGDSSKDYRSSIDKNWLFLGLYDWLITQVDNSRIYRIGGGGFISSNGTAYKTYTGYVAVRPCFYLNSNVEYYSGDGSLNNPYRIN